MLVSNYALVRILVLRFVIPYASTKLNSYHWYVLYKRFYTPFRDGIWNRRQVSVGDRGVLPTRPRNHRG